MLTFIHPNSHEALQRRREAATLPWRGPALMLFARSVCAVGAQAVVAAVFALRASQTPWRDGTGNGTVSFSVDPNPTSTRRTAVITVEDRTFAVKQAANFTDVPPDHLFFSEINILSANGITVGCAPGHYCPDEVVTREQMAALHHPRAR